MPGGKNLILVIIYMAIFSQWRRTILYRRFAMSETISRWLNKLETRRRSKLDMKDVWAEYFSSGINEDLELAQSMGVDLWEIEQMRREFEA
jgi:hypothetical protein